MLRSRGGEPRQPLLPAKQRRRARGAPQPLLRCWALLLVLAVLAGGALLLAWRAPSAATREAGAEEEARDSAAEQALLHEQPSEAFCALEGPPLVCAHGGDTQAAPPNTAAAFEAALAGGARCVEVDVARTRDGVLVVLHARELSHLLALAGKAAPARAHRGSGGGSGGGGGAPAPPQVGDYTWAELAQLRWEGGEGVERVADVLALVQRRTQQVTLDIKTHTVAGEDLDEDVMAQEVVNLVARTGCTHCLVWAKSDTVVKLVKDLQPAQRVGYVVLNETAAARAAGMHRLLRIPHAEVIALHFAMASQEVTARARAASKRVHAWTANTAGMMRAVLDAGVDAVVTNHPRKLQDAVDSRWRRCREALQAAQQEVQHTELRRKLQAEQRQGEQQQQEEQQQAEQQQQADQAQERQERQQGGQPPPQQQEQQAPERRRERRRR